MLDPHRTIAELQELRWRTSNELGARRIADTPPWHAARALLHEQLADLPVTAETDPADTLWKHAQSTGSLHSSSTDLLP